MFFRFAALILSFAAAAAIYGQSARDQSLKSLADAERAFSAETVKVGFRDGFIKYFADDGIGFAPQPQRTREVLQKSPAPAGKRTIIFKWTPMFGDVSLAGDLGYTTGPVLYTDISENPKPPRHGMYFSVWEKQADGSWKVVVDMGVSVPHAVVPLDVTFKAATPVTNIAKRVPTVNDYRDLDRKFTSSIFRTSPTKAYMSWLDPQFRIHRNGVPPLTDRKALGPVVVQTKFELIDGKLAVSNDLAFTYGKYSTVNDPRGPETGYYVHVWRRDASNEWKLVADIQNPLPKTS